MAGRRIGDGEIRRFGLPAPAKPHRTVLTKYDWRLVRLEGALRRRADTPTRFSWCILIDATLDGTCDLPVPGFVCVTFGNEGDRCICEPGRTILAGGRESERGLRGRNTR
jgi:hypothetical protein